MPIFTKYLNRKYMKDARLEKEVSKMTMTAINPEVYRKGKAEGRLEGRLEGKLEGRNLQKSVFKMLRQNQPDLEILNKLGISESELVSYKEDFEEIFGE